MNLENSKPALFIIENFRQNYLHYFAFITKGHICSEYSLKNSIKMGKVTVKIILSLVPLIAAQELAAYFLGDEKSSVKMSNISEL